MKIINTARLRRLIPAGAVAAVLAFSYLGPLPSAASSVGGFGYNCGVKGFGYHDHGKPCPNRPFPGQGNGVTKILSSGTSTSVGNLSPASHGKGSTTSLSDDNTTTLDTGNSASPGNGHGRGNAHGRGKSHINF